MYVYIYIYIYIYMYIYIYVHAIPVVTLYKVTKYKDKITVQ